MHSDMNHANMYIVGLALCTLANISSSEMARDLCSEVERLLGTSNTYIRKKAALCAVKIVRKVPDLCENFLARCRSLLNERSHGILLTGVTLIQELCLISPEALLEFRKLVPSLVKHLKSLLSSGFSPEHDVSGITDPFLQVKILQLLRTLGKDNEEGSEMMNDVLAQVATNTDSSKNVGNSILYEAVLTILNIQSDNGLKVMAINILGKFLANKDNNIRYVALNTLLKCVDIDNTAVQRHRTTITECLHDPDISIRKRALELSFALINESTVKIITKELLAFLEVADAEFLPSITAKLCHCADKYAPSKRWYVDTVQSVLKIAGNHAKEDIIANFIRFVATSNSIHHYAAFKLFSCIKNETGQPQEGLIQATAWIVGEYGQYLRSSTVFEEERLSEVSDEDMINLFVGLLNGPYCSNITKGYIINCLMKVGKFSQSAEYFFFSFSVKSNPFWPNIPQASMWTCNKDHLNT